MRPLQVQSTQHAATRVGQIILHQIPWNAVPDIVVSAVGLHEESPLVSEHLGLEDQDSRQLGGDYFGTYIHS